MVFDRPTSCNAIDRPGYCCCCWPHVLFLFINLGTKIKLKTLSLSDILVHATRLTLSIYIYIDIFMLGIEDFVMSKSLRVYSSLLIILENEKRFGASTRNSQGCGEWRKKRKKKKRKYMDFKISRQDLSFTDIRYDLPDPRQIPNASPLFFWIYFILDLVVWNIDQLVQCILDNPTSTTFFVSYKSARN